MERRNLAEEARPLQRGSSGSTVTRKCQATGEALLAPARNRWSRVGRITGDIGKSAEGQRVAEGSVVPLMPVNAGRGKGPCCFVTPLSKSEAGAK